jgi:CRP/FNR family cyclic AMP-dependent transcriptional regulator
MAQLELLHGLPLFEGLSHAALEALARGARVRGYRAGQPLWVAGAAAQALHVILSGEVRVVVLREGRRCTLHSESAGATLGDVPFFGGGGYPASAEAVGAVTCLLLPRAALARAVSLDPALAFRLLAGLAHRVRGLVARVGAQAALSVRERLLHFLERRAALAGGGVFTLGMSQAALAEELGTVREVVVRELRALRTAGRLQGAGRARYRLGPAT